MVPNAEQLKEQLLQHNEMQGLVFKMRNDPRVTPRGASSANTAWLQPPKIKVAV
jgi:hypothetical protein